jgi:hypothetical protein
VLGEPAAVVCEHERLFTPIADSVAEVLWRERAPVFIQKHYNPGFSMLSLIEDRMGLSVAPRPSP